MRWRRRMQPRPASSWWPPRATAVRRPTSPDLPRRQGRHQRGGGGLDRAFPGRGDDSRWGQQHYGDRCNGATLPAALSRPSCCAPPRAAFRSAATKKNMSTRASRASCGHAARHLRARRSRHLRQRHGAAAVAMINNGAGYPPFEGDIPGVGDPVPGRVDFRRAQVDRFRHGGACKRHARQPRLPGGRGLQFRRPALRRQSFEVQRGRAGRVDPLYVLRKRQSGERASGTSMSSPHVAGVAALVRQANPSWGQRALRAALEQTVEPGR